MRRIGESTTPEQPEDIKLEIESLRTEIEEAGNSVVDQIEAFLAESKDSEDPTKRDEARVALQQLEGFTLQLSATEASSGSTTTNSPGPASASSSTSKEGSFKSKVVASAIAFIKTIPENSRQNGGSSKRSNSEPTA